VACRNPTRTNWTRLYTCIVCATSLGSLDPLLYL